MVINLKTDTPLEYGASIMIYGISDSNSYHYQTTDAIYDDLNDYWRGDLLAEFSAGNTQYTYTPNLTDTIYKVDIVVKGTTEFVAFESFEFTWKLDENKVVIPVLDTVFEVSDTPYENPIKTTSPIDDLVIELDDPYVLTYNEEENTFLAKGMGYASLTIKSDTYSIYEFASVKVTEPLNKIYIKSNDTKNVVDDYWEIVSDPSTLIYGDVITIFSQDAYKGVKEFSDNKLVATSNFTYDAINNTFYDDEFIKYMLMPISGGEDDFALYSLNSNKYLSHHYFDDYWGHIDDYMHETVNLSSSGDDFCNWSFDNIKTTSDDKIVMKSGSYGPSHSLAYDGENFVCASGENNTVTILRYVGELNEKVEVNDFTQFGSSTAITFAHYFVSYMSDYCLTGKDNVVNAFNFVFTDDDWYNDYPEFSNVSYSIMSMTMFRLATADENGDIMQRACSLYDFLVSEYNLTNYLGRVINTSSNSGNNLFINNVNNNMIAIVSLVALSLVLISIPLYKKHKEDK